jgi:hypothetical protein
MEPCIPSRRVTVRNDDALSIEHIGVNSKQAQFFVVIVHFVKSRVVGPKIEVDIVVQRQPARYALPFASRLDFQESK